MNIERILVWVVLLFVAWRVFKHFTRPAKPQAGSGQGTLSYAYPSLR